jgi:hypothetical protein
MGGLLSVDQAVSRRLFARKSGFDPESVHVGFVVNQVNYPVPLYYRGRYILAAQRP